MQFWDQVVAGIPTVIIGALTIGLGALLVWGGRVSWAAWRGGRPDFTLTKRPDGTWEMERTRRRTAYELRLFEGVWLSNVYVAATTADGARMGDVRAGGRVPVGGALVWFTWIDKTRMHTRTVDLREGDRYELFGIDAYKAGEIRT